MIADKLVSGFNALKFGKTHKLVYEKLATDHPIELCRYQGRQFVIITETDFMYRYRVIFINYRDNTCAKEVFEVLFHVRIVFPIPEVTFSD